MMIQEGKPPEISEYIPLINAWVSFINHFFHWTSRTSLSMIEISLSQLCHNNEMYLLDLKQPSCKHSWAVPGCFAMLDFKFSSVALQRFSSRLPRPYQLIFFFEYSWKILWDSSSFVCQTFCNSCLKPLQCCSCHLQTFPNSFQVQSCSCLKSLLSPFQQFS